MSGPKSSRYTLTPDSRRATENRAPEGCRDRKDQKGTEKTPSDWWDV